MKRLQRLKNQERVEMSPTNKQKQMNTSWVKQMYSTDEQNTVSVAGTGIKRLLCWCVKGLLK